MDDPALGYTPNDLAEHVRSEYSTFSWLFDRMLDKTGFEVMERHFRRDVYATLHLPGALTRGWDEVHHDGRVIRARISSTQAARPTTPLPIT